LKHWDNTFKYITRARWGFQSNSEQYWSLQDGSNCTTCLIKPFTQHTTHTTSWNTFYHNTAEHITYFYWLIPQNCNFSNTQHRLPEDGPGWPKHVGANMRYFNWTF
jgi:hypothetical protein